MVWKFEEGWFGTVQGEIQTATRGTLQGLLFFFVFTRGPTEILVDNKFTFDGFRDERYANPTMGQAHADIWADIGRAFLARIGPVTVSKVKEEKNETS